MANPRRKTLAKRRTTLLLALVEVPLLLNGASAVSEADLVKPSTWSWQPFPLELARAATAFYQQPLVQLDFNKELGKMESSSWSPERLEDSLKRGANGSVPMATGPTRMTPAIYTLMNMLQPRGTTSHAKAALEIWLRNGVSLAEGYLKVDREIDPQYAKQATFFAVQNAKCEANKGLSAFGLAAISVAPEEGTELAVSLGVDPFDPAFGDALLAITAHPGADHTDMKALDLLVDRFGFPVDGSKDPCPDGSPRRTPLQEAFEAKQYKTAMYLVTRLGSQAIPELLKQRGLPTERPQDFDPGEDPENTELYKLLDARKEALAKFTTTVGQVRESLRKVQGTLKGDPSAMTRLQAVLNEAARLEETEDPFSAKSRKSLKFLETVAKTWSELLDARDPDTHIGHVVHEQAQRAVGLAEERSKWAATCGEEGRLTRN